MARGKRPATPVSSTAKAFSHPINGDWGGFVNIRMDEAEKEGFHSWYAQLGSSIWLTMQEYISSGLKLSISYDADGDFYLASFTGIGKDLIGIDLRCVLTARAPEWETAIALLVYKHEVMAHCNWGDYYANGTKQSNFG